MKKENKIKMLKRAFFDVRVPAAVLVWLLCAAFSLHAADLSVPEGGSAGLGPRPEVTVEVFREVRAGEDGVLAVVWLEMPAGYHAYANDMDGSGGRGSGVGLPTVVTVRGASSQAAAPAGAAGPGG
ncbi:thiol:disulfide interchange protein, partial [Desulfovibrio oxamicus]|nr:thiol:disulfide interchange protein [Nitratidesulfovibrio oxamicus]